MLFVLGEDAGQEIEDGITLVDLLNCQTVKRPDVNQLEICVELQLCTP